MLNLIKGCVPPWLNWKTGAMVALVLVGIAVCTGLPTWSFLAGATPLLLIAACLIPCLIPLAMLRKNGKPAVQVGEPAK